MKDLEKMSSAFYIHFDIDSHALPLADFVKSAQSTQKIINNLSENIFENKPQIKIIVCPPEKATFLAILGVIVIGGGGSVWAFLESDIGKRYIKGLTGREPADFAEELGIATVKKLPNIAKEVRNVLYATVISSCTAGFLTKSSAEIQALEMQKEQFKPALEAKNLFYETCLNNADIKAVGFDVSDKFSVNKENFIDQLSEIPEPEDNDKWIISSGSIRVESPTWNADGRMWVGKIKDKNRKLKDIHFSIADDNFWLHVMNKGLKKVKVGDNVIVQWARQQSKSLAAIKVLRVLEYNGQKISNPLTAQEIDAEMAKLNYKYEFDSQNPLPLLATEEMPLFDSNDEERS